MRAFIAIILAGALTYAYAQWLNYPDPRTPRTKDGKPNLTAPAPRLNGKPDLTGLWQAERTPAEEYERVLGKQFTVLQVDAYDVTKNVVNIFWGLKPEEEPLRPEAVSIMQQRTVLQSPLVNCLPAGIPMALLVYSFKIIQTPQEIVVLTETADPPREIHIDGRPLPKDPNPSWMGYSVGRWDAETLVVDTAGLNDRAWLDGARHPRSESMRITERYLRRDFGHMDLEITFSDPTYYTRPFSIRTGLSLIPDSDRLEYVCNENEKDRLHLAK